MRRRRPQPPPPEPAAVPSPASVRADPLDLVLARPPVAVPERDAASALIHARLTEADLEDLRRHRGGDYLALWEAAETEAQRRRIDLLWTAHLALPGPLRSTGLLPDMPPPDVHAMAHGPLAAGGDHYLADATLDAFEQAGLVLGPDATVLDFGCSSGRVTRVLAAARPDVRWLGCDPNEAAVAWAREHLPLAEFFVSPPRPPLDLDDGALDAAFAISIWSHFAEKAALTWLDELHRIIRPGGLLLLTTHGLTSVARSLPEGAVGEDVAHEAVAATLRGEHHFVDVWGEEGDWGILDPEWGDAWCTPEWLTHHVTPAWSVRLFRPGGLDGNQDLFVLRREPVVAPRPADRASPAARRERITAVIRFHERPQQVARLVEFVAPHVDEVVVVASESLSPDALDPVADAMPERLLRIADASHPDVATPYLVQAAGGDWALRLDGDEVPSPRLLRALRDLVAAPDLVLWRLDRLWAWPDTAHFLAQRPWWPDPQARLSSQKPGATHWSGAMHAGARALGSWRDIDLPIIHLDLVQRSREARERKCAWYASVRRLPDIEGLPFNEAYYLPELRDPAPALLPLSQEDRAAVAWVIDGVGPRPEVPRRLRRRRPATDVPVVPRAELEAAIPVEDPPGPAPLPVDPSVAWSPATARVRLENADLDPRWFAGARRAQRVRLINEGELDLTDAPAPGVRVRAHWSAAAAPAVETGLSSRARPGEELLVLVPLVAPDHAGEHELLVEVVDGEDRLLGEPLRLALTAR